jgi:hypothetical protein
LGEAFNNNFVQSMVAGAHGYGASKLLGHDPLTGGAAGILGELVAEGFQDRMLAERNPTALDSQSLEHLRERGLALSRLTVGALALVGGREVETAVLIAGNAAQYNSFGYAFKRLAQKLFNEATKQALKEGTKGALEAGVKQGTKGGMKPGGQKALKGSAPGGKGLRSHSEGPHLDLKPTQVTGKKQLLPGEGKNKAALTKRGALKEGQVGTYGELHNSRVPGDHLTPNHMPQAAYMRKHGVKKEEGVAMMMEHPHPGMGGRHRQTRTYGKQPALQARPRSELAKDVVDARKIYRQDGIYTADIHQALKKVITQNKARFPELFKKGGGN